MVGCKHLGFDITIHGIFVLASTYSSQATVCACRLIYDENILYDTICTLCTLYLPFILGHYVHCYLLCSIVTEYSNFQLLLLVNRRSAEPSARSGMKFENPLVAKYGVKDGTAGSAVSLDEASVRSARSPLAQAALGHGQVIQRGHYL